MQLAREAYVKGVSTRKIDAAAKAHAIEGISAGQTSSGGMVEEFRNRLLRQRLHALSRGSTLCSRRGRVGGRCVSMAAIVVRSGK